MEIQNKEKSVGADLDLSKSTLPSPVYRNPKPVVVLLVPVQSDAGDIGLLVIRRKLKDGYGELALPGGYQNEGEGWREAGGREVHEETGLEIPNLHKVQIKGVEDSSGCKQILLFGQAEVVPEADLPEFVPNDEVFERTVIYEPRELAFPTHTEQARLFFERQ